jgi:hypothetical protein
MINLLEYHIISLVKNEPRVLYSLAVLELDRLYSDSLLNYTTVTDEAGRDEIIGTLISLTKDGYIKREMIFNDKWGNGMMRYEALYSITLKGMWALWVYNKTHKTKLSIEETIFKFISKYPIAIFGGAFIMNVPLIAIIIYRLWEGK